MPQGVADLGVLESFPQGVADMVQRDSLKKAFVGVGFFRLSGRLVSRIQYPYRYRVPVGIGGVPGLLSVYTVVLLQQLYWYP